MTLTTFLADDDFDANMDSGSYGSIIISEGSRNATMSHYAGRILKRFGNTEEARRHFTEVAACCQPPLEQSELDSIWRSAQRFYGKISAQDGYIPPEQYNQELIKKALGVSDLPLEITDTKVSFPWFPATPAPDEMNAYDAFICKLCEMARNQKRVNTTEKHIDNEKYAFRCFLLRLGFIGAEYKEARKILLKNLSGSSAFKNGGADHAVSE